MTYNPTPIDNSGVRLSQALTELIERLAANNHDLWARRRMAEGWRYGPSSDDKGKQTPLLVPYDKLPESEKHYDRENAIETLKTIVGLGWTIEDPKQPAHTAPLREEYQKKAKQANAEGEAIRSLDISSEGLKLWPGDLKLRRMQALALARMGSGKKSHSILQELQTEGHEDEETLGLLARTYKDLWLRSGNATDLDQAHGAYLKAFEKAPASYWTGINAGTLAFVKGDGQTARALARQVRRVCDEMREQVSNNDPYWLTATRAEACLLLDLLPEAEELYTLTGKLGRERPGDIVSTWGNARLILSLMDSSVADRIERALDVPRVVIFAGHRVDEPGTAPPRFPEDRTEEISERIKERLLDTRSRFGYSSAASGSDILFLEAMQSIGGKTYIVLPCDEAQFVQESVATSGEHWVGRFQAVKAKANEVIASSRERLNLGSVAYDFSNELLYGLANLRAKQFGTDLVHLAVWDGREAARHGGTADILKRWRERTSDVIVLRPLDAKFTEGQDSRTEPIAVGEQQDHSSVPGFASEIRAMLFADAYHFSRLTEAQMPSFIRNFMSTIAMLVNQTRPRPLFQNTWGDGLYIVFSTVLEAGRFALNLAKRVAGIDRKSSGLPEDMTLRIALHAGPVYRYKDQIIDKANYIGSHVNRAARIEPITPPGQIYATDAFAALAELDGPGYFRFDYVGRIALAKGFGEYPMYNVQSGE
jgi:class 3 adenylate cyclase